MTRRSCFLGTTGSFGGIASEGGVGGWRARSGTGWTGPLHSVEVDPRPSLAWAFSALGYGFGFVLAQGFPVRESEQGVRTRVA